MAPAKSFRFRPVAGMLILSLMFICCTKTPGWGELSVLYEGRRPVALFAPADLLNFPSRDAPLTTVLRGDNRKLEIQTSLDNYGLKITPRKGLQQNVSYQLLANGKVVGQIRIPKHPSDSVGVSAFYPGSDTIPENLSEISLRFSESMDTKGINNYFSWRNLNKAKNLSLPDLKAGWNEEGTVLTFFLKDKSALQQDNNYELNIGKGWPSASGRMINQSVSKRFKAVAASPTRPRIEHWKLHIPYSGSRQVLRIEFGKDMDSRSITKYLSIRYSDGSEVQGSLSVGNDERSAAFYPAWPWAKGRYHIQAEPGIRDLSGGLLLTDQSGSTSERAFSRAFEINP